MLKNLETKKYKFKYAVIGDNLETKHAKIFGFLTRNRAIDIISKSKFAVLGILKICTVTLCKIVCRDNVKIFYNKNLKNMKYLKINL